MDRQLLRAELARPVYLAITALLVAMVIGTWYLLLVVIRPAQTELHALEDARVGLVSRQDQYLALDGDRQAVKRWAGVLPEMASRLSWRGSSTDFSQVILDSATRVGIRLDREINELREIRSTRVYSKTLYFTGSYRLLEQFLSELGRQDVLIVPGSLSVEPAGEGSDLLAITLSLTGYSESES